MPDIEFRMFFNNKPATREQLDSVEEIIVEQEVDMAWEARIKIPVCVDEKGNWTGVDKDFMSPFSQTRVEIKIDKNPFVGLIDGPIVEIDNPMDSTPGKSFITLVVQDDSTYLNREESIKLFENKSDHEIARQIFQDTEHIASTDIEETPAPAGDIPPVEIQRGTQMQILRKLAKRQGMHAYVLPGDSPGKSIGCFKSFPSRTDGLPSLVLLGSNRNLENFTPKNDAQSPSTFKASTVNIIDKKIITKTSRFSDIDLLGEEPGFEDKSKTSSHFLSHYQCNPVDLERAVAAEAYNSSFSFEATGRVLDLSYCGVLLPYRVVTIEGVNNRLRGNYLISRVTHILTRSTYSQSFTVMRNARSASGDSGNPARRIF
jgi:hypothetical protein